MTNNAGISAINRLKSIVIGKHKMNGTETAYQVHLVSEIRNRNIKSEFKKKVTIDLYKTM